MENCNFDFPVRGELHFSLYKMRRSVRSYIVRTWRTLRGPHARFFRFLLGGGYVRWSFAGGL